MTTLPTSKSNPLPQWQQDCLEVISSDADLCHYEETVAKQPYDIASWIVYLEAIDHRLDDTKSNSTTSSTAAHKQKSLISNYRLRDFVGRRALERLPRSYKLWKLQWEFLQFWEKRVLADATTSRQKSNEATENSEKIEAVRLVQSIIIKAFERAFWTLHSFPRVWIIYLQWLQNHSNIFSTTRLRRLVNRALQATAITQHSKLWPAILAIYYNPSAETTESWQLPLESQIRILRRYAEYHPPFQTEFADWLLQTSKNNKKLQAAGSAAVLYQSALNNHDLLSAQQRQEAWMAFLAVGSQFPKAVQEAGVLWERIVRGALRTLQQKQRTRGRKNNDNDDTEMYLVQDNITTTDDTTLLEGYLWTQLADFWIRQGQFDAARSVFEEGLQSVHKIRDFSVLYNAYLQFEEGLLTAATARLEEAEEDGEESSIIADEAASAEVVDDWDLLLPNNPDYNLNTGSTNGTLAEMEWALARAEHLTKRRPLLLNQVMLRQNPNNVAEWLKRADLFVQANQPSQAVNALEEALQTVFANKAMNGTPSEIVIQLVKLYCKEQKDIDAARDLLDRICHQEVYRFRKSNDLAECWLTWIELELGNEAWENALSLARQSVASGSSKYLNLTKSLRLWDLLLDLEESLGTVQTTKDTYNRAIEIKAATVQHVLNFAAFLTEQKYFEESFTAYERGIELFAFPHPGAKLLWKAYLDAFEKRYQGTKIERMRDLFQRCLEACPPEECSEFFIMNGNFEERYGLAKRALTVYRNMCHKVPKNEKLLAFQLFIAKTAKYLGHTATRDIYQEAIESIYEQDAANLCLEFCVMETSLEQIERARAILSYGAQMADPRRMPDYWKFWNEFEIAHGNEETFREMLRIKRSVEAAFSTVNYNAFGMSEKIENLSNEEAISMIAAQEGVDLEPQPTTSVEGFVASKRKGVSTSLDDVEERVAKLRKATRTSRDSNENENSDEDVIDIDDIDAEIEAAAAAGTLLSTPIRETGKTKNHDITTKSVPAAVFGGLAPELAMHGS